jgi:hypothetical protein
MSLLNGDGLSVLSWRIDANGNVAPSAVISGSNTGLSNQSRGLAADAQGNLYVTSGTSISVFAASANGNVAPLRVIQGSNVLGPTTNGYGLSSAIAVDGQGQIFAGGVGVIEVFAAGANGNAAPARLMTGSNVTDPSAMALDGPDLYVSDGGVVHVFDAGANGNVTSKRTLTVTGPTAASFTNVQLAFDGSGNLYLPVASLSAPTAANTWVAVYAPTATSPSPVLTGAATELTAATGVALDPQGNIFVANADPGAAAIVVFVAGASGGATPIRNVSGPSTGINVGGGVLKLVVY